MPTIANITVKKADGITDIVYDALAGAGGDKTPAMFRQDTGATASLPVGMRARFEVQAQYNGPKTARRITGTFEYPYAVLSADTNAYTSADKAIVSFSAVMPLGIPSATLNEAAAQALNLFASSLIKSTVQTGYSPT